MKKSELKKLESGMNVYNRKTDNIEEYIDTVDKNGKVKVKIGEGESTKLISFGYFKKNYTLDFKEEKEVKKEDNKKDEPSKEKQKVEEIKKKSIKEKASEKVKKQNNKKQKNNTSNNTLLNLIVNKLKQKGCNFKKYKTSNYIGLKSKKVFVELYPLKSGFKAVVDNKSLDDNDRERVTKFDKYRHNNSRFYIKSKEDIENRIDLIYKAYLYSFKKGE